MKSSQIVLTGRNARVCAERVANSRGSDLGKIGIQEFDVSGVGLDLSIRQTEHTQTGQIARGEISSVLLTE
jgi:hypothetical protein